MENSDYIKDAIDGLEKKQRNYAKLIDNLLKPYAEMTPENRRIVASGESIKKMEEYENEMRKIQEAKDKLWWAGIGRRKSKISF